MSCFNLLLLAVSVGEVSCGCVYLCGPVWSHVMSVIICSSLTVCVEVPSFGFQMITVYLFILLDAISSLCVCVVLVNLLMLS